MHEIMFMKSKIFVKEVLFLVICIPIVNISHILIDKKCAVNFVNLLIISKCSKLSYLTLIPTFH